NVTNQGVNAFVPTKDNKTTNTGKAKGNEAGPVPSSVDTPITYAPGISILKTVSSVEDVNGDSKTDAGDIIHYNIHVANTGDVTRSEQRRVGQEAGYRWCGDTCEESECEELGGSDPY